MRLVSGFNYCANLNPNGLVLAWSLTLAKNALNPKKIGLFHLHFEAVVIVHFNPEGLAPG